MKLLPVVLNPNIAKVFEPILSLNHQVLMTIGGQLVDSNFR
jgi:hypothetical protein